MGALEITLIITISSIVSLTALFFHVKKIEKLFFGMLEEYREQIKDVTIDTIKNWLESTHK
ncbi:MAG: hypothetical protein GX053_12810 [Tissierella sp.]|nr:hypothetical protein [Tissierella sp.]